MKAPEPWLRGIETMRAVRQVAVALLAWAVRIATLPFVRRRVDWIVVVSRPAFLDNSKYFFTHAVSAMAGRGRVVLLGGSRSLIDAIRDRGGEAMLHPSPASLWLLLRCGVVVTDVSGWFDHGAFPLTHGAKRVQMWHGAPLKHIELDVFQRRLDRTPRWRRPALRAVKALTGRYPRFDIVLTTSRHFSTEIFSGCFRAGEFLATGYPRNDALMAAPDTPSGLHAINVDLSTLEKVASARAQGRTVCLYAPTFRKALSSPIGTVLDAARLSDFAERNGFLFVTKLHPFMAGRQGRRSLPGILDSDPTGDIYPIMRICDVLITDYSSIYFDFLLLDRPVVFFAYDLEDYLANDRDMYFEFREIAPGPVCETQAALESTLGEIRRNAQWGSFESARSRVRSLVHDHVDGRAAERLLLRCLDPPS